MQLLYWSLKTKNAQQLNSMCLKNNGQNKRISELHADVKKTKYSRNPNDILKSAKHFNEKLSTRDNLQNSHFWTF